MERVLQPNNKSDNNDRLIKGNQVINPNWDIFLASTNTELFSNKEADISNSEFSELQLATKKSFKTSSRKSLQFLIAQGSAFLTTHVTLKIMADHFTKTVLDNTDMTVLKISDGLPLGPPLPQMQMLRASDSALLTSTL